MRGVALRRLLPVLTVLFCLLAGVSVARAQEDPAPEPEPAPEPTPVSEPGPEPTPVPEPEPAPEPTPAAEHEPASEPTPAADDAGDPDPAEDEEEEPEPRCADHQLDLSPDAPDPTCISKRELAGLLASFEAAAAEEAAALAQLNVTLDALATAEAALEEKTAELADVQLRQGEAETDVRFAAIRVSVARESLDDVEAALAAEEDDLEQQAVQAYIGGDSLSLEVATGLFDMESPSELFAAQQYASIVISDQLATIDDVEALRRAADALETAVRQVEEEAQADADRVVQLEEEAQVILAFQRELVAQIEEDAADLAEQIAAIQARKSQYAEQLSISGAGGGSIGALLSRVQAGQVPLVDTRAFLDLPLETTRIGSGFGPRVHPIFQDTRLHSGVDLSGKAGQSIFASADGVVVMAEATSGYGNLVVIDHGNTLATLYAHLTADAVSVGEEVERGQLIGYVGSTGWSTGPHLHYEVRVSGQPVDPLPYLDL